ncbi:MAG: Antitoxin Phd YefM, type toxin-antitoxin system [Gammaproteobacteria bacterium]|jgi:prevent-host-death family protein|nr:Antitoxin Phd YefM, type toxin-antitoxin system [Gammaproteobacteria bacterium]
MIIVNTHEAKTKLSQLLAEIEQHHTTVRICRHGKPIADIVPIKQKVDHLKMHSELYQGAKINYNPTEPLTEDEWPEEYR